MSGGHFEYNQYRIDDIADQIDRLVERNGKDEDEYAITYSQDTIRKFKMASIACKEAAKMVQRVDWLASGDDGEDSFHRRWKE